jgi:rubredoxin
MEENSEEIAEIRPLTQAKRIYRMWLCPICGTRTWITNKKRHLETKKHKDVLYITTERFEIR